MKQRVAKRLAAGITGMVAWEVWDTERNDYKLLMTQGGQKPEIGYFPKDRVEPTIAALKALKKALKPKREIVGYRVKLGENDYAIRLEDDFQRVNLTTMRAIEYGGTRMTFMQAYALRAIVEKWRKDRSSPPAGLRVVPVYKAVK